MKFKLQQLCEYAPYRFDKWGISSLISLNMATVMGLLVDAGFCAVKLPCLEKQ